MAKSSSARRRNGAFVKQLRSYATAASATAAYLATSGVAHAKVVYTKINYSLFEGSPSYVLNPDGVHPALTLTNTVVCYSNICPDILEATGLDGGEVAGTTPYTAGQTIGPGTTFIEQITFIGIGVPLSSGPSVRFGTWGHVLGGYFGFKFQINGKTHYGWARIRCSLYDLAAFGTLEAFAYETLPDKPIKTGYSQDSEVDQRTASGPTLGALAFGAAGLPYWRREESISESDVIAML